MKNKLIALVFIMPFMFQSVLGQEFYVDSEKGNDINSGEINQPFKTIQKAIEVTNNLMGIGDVTIKIMPGIYVLNNKININPVRIFDENSKLIIESALLPGDSLWTPVKMPVVISYSANNSETQFPHSIGFLVASNFVEFRGIKFLGNANPSVLYYYPITRENPNLKNLVVSQCVFIGDRNSGIIQGGVWAHGTDININHNVFYQCRNAILLFENINYSVISNNIIYGAYESAFWLENDENLTFSNNIVSNCEYFWIGDPNNKIKFEISNSIISNNKHFRGCWGERELVESKQKFIEKNINKKDIVKLVECHNEYLPKTHLHIETDSPGYNLNAGIFK